MTLLLDAEARLFFVPEETREPTARRADTPRRGATGRHRDTQGTSAPAAPPALRDAALEPATWAAPTGHGPTLDDLLSETWDGLVAGAAPAACPVCDGELVRRWSAGAGVVGGRCRDCGSELS